MFALLRSISEIIGKPPIKAVAVLAMPTPSISPSRFVFRFSGSSMSTALALIKDSKVPIMENNKIHFAPAKVNTAVKSGNVSPSRMLSGMVTRNFGPSMYSWLSKKRYMCSCSRSKTYPRVIPKISTIIGAGKTFLAFSGSMGNPNSNARLTAPMQNTSGLHCIKLAGISPKRSKGVFERGVTPKST